MRIPVLECYSWSKFFSVELSFCECSSKNLESQIHVCFIQSSHILEQFSLHISQKIFQSTITRTVIIIPFFFKDRHRFNRSWMEPSDTRIRSGVLCEINCDFNSLSRYSHYLLLYTDANRHNRPMHFYRQGSISARDGNLHLQSRARQISQGLNFKCTTHSLIMLTMYNKIVQTHNVFSFYPYIFTVGT